MAIKFWRTTGKYGCFSNFSTHSVEIDGRRWPTTEHYYQAMKFEDFDDQERVRKTSTPKKSKEEAYKKECRPDWEEIKYDVMMTALRAKAEQYEIIAKKLIESGNEEIIEDSPYDYIWGCGKDGTGQNLLGKAWMQVREELRETTDV